MLDLYLEQLELYRKLKEREATDSFARTAAGVLVPIAGDAREFLEFVRHSFPSYTRHNQQHSFAILKRVAMILSPDALNALTSVEIFSLIMAGLFHDSGMASDSGSLSQESVRREHHKRSKDTIEKYFDERLQIISEYTPRLKKCVAFAAEAHNLEWDEMTARPEFSITNSVADQKLRPSVLAILLRVGDLLDCDSDRTCQVTRKIHPGFFSDATSQAHHRRHDQVEVIDLDSSFIRITVRPQTRLQHQLWHQWFSYLRQDIEKANTYVFVDKLKLFQLPRPELQIVPAEAASYEFWPLRFELDRSGRILQLISKSIYTKENDYVRELIQNGLDATLARVYLSPRSDIRSASPRSWSCPDFSPSVLLVFDEDFQVLEIHDNGIGMNREALEKFLFTVAGSGFEKIEAVHGSVKRFPAIACFGIGFISVMTRATSLVIDTKTVDEASGRRVLVQEGMGEAYVERVQRRGVGTSISIKLRHKTTASSLVKFVEEHFSFTSAPIYTVDVRGVRDLMRLATDLDLDLIAFANLRLMVEQQRENRPFAILDHEEFFRFEDSLRKCTTAVANEVERLRDIFHLGSRSQPLDVQTRFVNAKLRDEAGKSGFGESSSRTKFTRSQVRGMRPPPQLIKEHSKPSFQRVIPDHTTVLVLDGSCLISDVLTGNFDTLRPSATRMIVWAPVHLVDYELGIEWQSIHGFLAERGQIMSHVTFPGGQRRATYPIDDPSLRVMCDDIIVVDFEVDDDSEARRHGTSMLGERGWHWARGIRYGADDAPGEGVEELYTDLQSSFVLLKNNAYQDGIVLPVPAWVFAPIGACRGLCNFTAAARIPLNVTRNDIDETPDVLDAWWRSAGAALCSSVVNQLSVALDEVGLVLDQYVLDVGLGTKEGLAVAARASREIRRIIQGHEE